MQLILHFKTVYESDASSGTKTVPNKFIRFCNWSEPVIY